MYIQKNILPKWNSELQKSELENVNIDHWMKTGRSMAEYLDRFLMKEVPENWFNGWMRYKYPLKVSNEIFNGNEIIGINFINLMSNIKKSKSKVDFIFEKLDEYEKIQTEKSKIYLMERTELEKLKEELPRKNSKKNKQEQKPKINIEKKINQTKNLDHDSIYKKWMTMVESKTMSKSYWHIHDYMSRYILKYATENGDNGLVTYELVESFLKEYGKGKRPKTMNHYNRVVYRFWDFYEKLMIENEENVNVW
ncbi:MAG: hypothetical protein VW886_02980 [Candidatus Heimdallarchaeota archaeon]